MSNLEELARFTVVGDDLALVGDWIDTIAQASLAEVLSESLLQSRESFHITVATEDELRGSSFGTGDEWSFAILPDSINSMVDLGVVLQNGVYFSVILWQKGDEIRRDLGLPAKEFHIELGQQDTSQRIAEEVDVCSFLSRTLSPVAVSTMIAYCRSSAQCPNPPSSLWLAISNHISRIENVDAEVLDRLAVMVYRAKNMNNGLEISKRLMSCFPADPRGYFRAAAYYSHGAKTSTSRAPGYSWKLAMALYGEALKQAIALRDQSTNNPSSFAEMLVSQAAQAILQCAKHTEFGCVATEAEILDFPSNYFHLISPWNPAVRNAVLQAFIERGEPDPLTLLSLDSRERMLVYSPALKQFLKLPRFFRWITPFRLAAMSTPRNAVDIQLLAALGVVNVVTLTKEEPLKAKWFEMCGSTNFFIPVSNYKAPTIAQVDNFFNAFDTCGSATLIHCGGGKGRAGTFIACYLARYGFVGVPDQEPRYRSAKEVLNIVRHIRPGSIETDEQERFIAKYLKELWKRTETRGKVELIPEPEPEGGSSRPVLCIEGKINPKCKLIVCCGIPGSGKSSVANALAQRAGWVVACQDECGSREACAQVLSAAMRQNRAAVVDRCNPTVRDRREWIDLAMLNFTQTVCLFFDYDKDLCLQRADGRMDHPTLEAGRARNAVLSMHKALQRPTMAENFGAIVTIRSISEANTFIERFCGPAQASSADQDSKAASSSSSSRHDSQSSKLKEFHKFPRTRHLLNFGSATRDDLIMTKAEAAAFLTGDGPGTDITVVTLEEKVDGANVGFSIDPDTGQIRTQNRSHFVTSKSHPQFKKLDLWIADHHADLLNLLRTPLAPDNEATPGRYILFGEWLQATHSIRYTRLPDYFLAFDLYDAEEETFWSRERFDARLRKTSIQTVPRIPLPEGGGDDIFQELMNRRSEFCDGPLEGVYVRRDMGPVLLDRAKVVRRNFLSGNAHWSKHTITNNLITWS